MIQKKKEQRKKAAAAAKGVDVEGMRLHAHSSVIVVANNKISSHRRLGILPATNQPTRRLDQRGQGPRPFVCRLNPSLVFFPLDGPTCCSPPTCRKALVLSGGQYDFMRPLGGGDHKHLLTRTQRVRARHRHQSQRPYPVDPTG
jgi:hypothetical protein